MVFFGKTACRRADALSRCQRARLAIRHFAQLTKRIAKCRKRNPASRILLRAICVAQINAVCCGKKAGPPRSASGSVPHAACLRRIARRDHAVNGPIAIDHHSIDADVAAFTVARSGATLDELRERAEDQARRRSRTLEGCSPKRVVYSREKVERREKPQPVAIAATESSGLALSSRWRARSSR